MHVCAAPVAAKVAEQQQQLAALAAELRSCEDVSAQRARELERVNRALEVRVAQLRQHFDGDGDVAAQLLHSLAGARARVEGGCMQCVAGGM
jgi:hypothetical protein